jgi:hypothetical protein
VNLSIGLKVSLPAVILFVIKFKSVKPKLSTSLSLGVVPPASVKGVNI